MKELLFKAYIPYSLMQAREAKIFEDDKIAGNEMEFTFQDIVGGYTTFDGKTYLQKPLFNARELIIPWLQKGGIPEIITNE